jgi:hypothetical protein
MHKVLAGASLICTLFVAATDAHAQAAGAERTVESLALLRARSIDRAPDRPLPQVAIESKFVEVSVDVRYFFDWKSVSGNDPAVVKHEVESAATGIEFNLGYKLGERPIWAQVGGYYSTGLETNTTLADGERIHGEIDDYGVGAGVRLVPYNVARVALFLWLMGYYDRNDGDFDIVDGAPRSENRIHTSFMGDYGVGVIYLIKKALGVQFGISYNGIFDSNNADENLRILLGFILNSRDRTIVP